MRYLANVALVLLLLAGCSSQPRWDTQHQQRELFRPTAMRIHPVFTQVRDWSNNGRLDGFEVLVEFQDRFGDPTKAAGAFVFEVFQYRPGHPDVRGARLGTPFLVSVENAAAQRDHWNRTARCYNFQLAHPQVSAGNTYVLTASFELVGGGRFSDRIVLTPAPAAPPPTATTRPAEAPEEAVPVEPDAE